MTLAAPSRPVLSPPGSPRRSLSPSLFVSAARLVLRSLDLPLFHFFLFSSFRYLSPFSFCSLCISFFFFLFVIYIHRRLFSPSLWFHFSFVPHLLRSSLSFLFAFYSFLLFRFPFFYNSFSPSSLYLFSLLLLLFFHPSFLSVPLLFSCVSPFFPSPFSFPSSPN